jgi:hypothetical protein
VTAYVDNIQFFVHTWAEAVIRQIDRVRTAQQKWANDFRAAERMEEGGLSDEALENDFRMRWTEEHTLIWAAHQLEEWSHRLTVARGEVPPEQDEVLAKVRNTLEHLNEADFEKGHAVPGALGSNRSLRELPGGRLSIALGSGLLSDLITTDELEERALSVVQKIQDELEAELQAQVDAYLEMVNTNR